MGLLFESTGSVDEWPAGMRSGAGGPADSDDAVVVVVIIDVAAVGPLTLGSISTATSNTNELPHPVGLLTSMEPPMSDTRRLRRTNVHICMHAHTGPISKVALAHICRELIVTCGARVITKWRSIWG